MDTFALNTPLVDAHVHLRDGEILSAVAPLTARQFDAAIIEPNLLPPITNGLQAREYRERIKLATPENPDFEPYMLAYLTDSLDPVELYDMVRNGDCIGGKFYPCGVTTNSDSGIVDVTTLYTPGTRQFECIQAIGKAGGVVQLHCELNFTLDGTELDPYDKEAYFFKHILPKLLAAHQVTKFSCEHLTSREGADFIDRYGSRYLGASITAHHLLSNRTDMFRGGLRPHLFCLPPTKREEHRQALLWLLTRRNPYVYAGTDSAPHDKSKKESDCCSGGIVTSHAAIECYAQAYEEIRPLDSYFLNFLGKNAVAFYGLLLPRARPSRRLVWMPWHVEDEIPYDDGKIIRPFGYSQREADGTDFMLRWKLAE